MAEELVTSSQAAEMLGIGVRQFQKMVRAGTVRPHAALSPSTKKCPLFSTADISALREIRDVGVSLEAVMLESRKSAIETRALRRELKQVKDCLGLNLPTLPTDRDTIISCLLKAEDALREQTLPDRDEVLYWAKVFHGVSEAHLEAIKLHTRTKEPWKTLVALARKLCLEQPFYATRTDIELEHIYNMLNNGLRALRRTAYFYVRAEHGNLIAAEAFPEVKGCPHEDVIALAFSEPPL